MQDTPNITKIRGNGVLRGMGMVAAGFVSMVAGLCLGSYITDARYDRTTIQGTRRDVVLRMAHLGPIPLRHAAMAVMSDGVVTVREERHLYMVADQIRLAEEKVRRSRDDDADMSRRHRPQII